MWQVYEQFVGTALTESLRRYPGQTQTAPQFTCSLDEAEPGHSHGDIGMALDVVHLVDGIPRLIFDAKYKAEDSVGRHPNADHYQMLAYCTALSYRERGSSTLRETARRQSEGSKILQ